jgi:transcriptional regulator with XRE-family HTH domain
MITPAHLRQTLDVIGLTDAAIAKICGINQSTLYRWLAGKVPIHPGVMLLLELLAIEDVMWKNNLVRQKVIETMNGEKK